MTFPDPPVQTDKQWHLSKSVNISVIMAILFSWGSGFYFFGNLQRDVTNNARQIAELKSDDLKVIRMDVDTLEDIVNDHNAIISRTNETLRSIENTLSRLEKKIDENSDNIPR